MKHVLNILLIYSMVFSPVASTQVPGQQPGTTGEQQAAALQQFLAGFQAQMANQQAQLRCQQETMHNQRTYLLKPLQDENFPQCKVIQARGNRMYQIHQCRQPDQSQTCGIKSFYEISEQNQNTLDNYLGDHTQKKSTGYGKTCLEKAAENLGASYDKVIADLQGHLTAMKREKENKVTELQPILDQIKINDAMINGEEGENKKKLLKSTNFAKFFKDSSCKTMIDKTTANQMGRGGNEANGGGGLRSIENMLESNFTRGNPSPQKFLAEQPRIKKEILDSVSKIADELDAAGLNASVSGQVKPSFGDTEYGVGTSKSLEAAVKESLRPHENFIKKTQRKAQKYIGSNSAYRDLVSKAYQTDIDMEEELRVYEKNFKDSCFANNSAGKLNDLNRIIRKLEDRKGRISKKKQRKADNPFKNKLNSIVDNSDLTVEDKLQQVLEAEKKGSGQNWVLRSGSTIPCGDSTITASGATRLSDIMSCYYKDCNQRFNSRRKGTKGYPPKAITKLAQKIHARVKAKEATFKSDITEHMLGRMLNCKGMDTKAKGTNSCKDPNNFSVAGSRFCMKQAVQCSTNISGCMEKTKAKVKELEKKKFDKSLEYRGIVMRYKKNLKDRFDQIQGYVDAAAKRVQSIFPAASWFGDEDYKKSFAMDDFQNLNKAAMFPDANNIDPALLMEDPEKYYDLMVQKVQNVIAKVMEHKNKALQQAAKERSTYLAEWAREKGFWEGLRGKCMAAIDGINAQIAANNKAQQEAHANRMKEIGEFCMTAETFNAFPDCDQLKDLYEDALKSAGVVGRDPKYLNAIAEYRKKCQSYNNEKEAAETYYVSESSALSKCKAEDNGIEGCEELDKCIAAEEDYNKKFDEWNKIADDEEKAGKKEAIDPVRENMESLCKDRSDHFEKIAKVMKKAKEPTSRPFDNLGEKGIAHTSCQAPSNEQQPGKYIFETLNRGLAGAFESSSFDG
ncbi:hypothetical protein N9N67_06815 [Bacteriovoracaceae bacterium]|nr:hypothetical protein [Bacteriovoracaceae bacterium]